MSQEVFNAFESDDEVNHVDSQPADRPEKETPDESFFSSKRLALFVEDEKSLPESSSSTSSNLVSRSLQQQSSSSSSASGLCGPEYMRDDNFIRRTHDDKKIKGTIKLIITNLNNLKTKVTSSFHTIAGLPWFDFFI
uniref:Uncharacterized protein n=1 Tax=Panagrolaimus superbus TaxID=310955 RepID=A0A914XYY0_9BILA